MPTSQLLEDLLMVHKKVTRSWIKGKYFDAGGHACAVGAIARATGITPEVLEELDDGFEVTPLERGRRHVKVWEPRCERARAVSQAIYDQLPEKFRSRYSLWTMDPEYCIPNWNDHRDTTKDDVLEVVCRAVRKEALRLGVSPEDVAKEVGLEGPPELVL